VKTLRLIAFAACLLSGAAQAQVIPTPFPGVPVTGVFSGADTASASASLAAAPGRVTHICGFSISGLGSTAGGPVSVTVATLAGGNTETFSYVFTASVTTANTPVTKVYTPCMPSNAVNSAIIVTVPGQAGNTATQINVEGFQR
jgi:hypothetical protein